MRPMGWMVGVPAILLVAGTVALAVSRLAPGPVARTQIAGPGPAASDEVARIQSHLLGAERLLDARGVSGLSPAARAARALHRKELRRYRERGVFPRNLDCPGRRMPYFVDAAGVRCAMAHPVIRDPGPRCAEYPPPTSGLPA